MKRTVCTIVAATFSLFSFGQVNISNGLVAHYPFDGTTNDASGNNYDPQSPNPPALTDDCQGNSQSAYEFDGVNDFLEVDHNSDISFGNNDNFAISLWFKSPPIANQPASATVGDLVSKWSGLVQDPYNYTVRLGNDNSPNPGIIKVIRYDGSCGNASSIQSAQGYNDDKWHHVVFQHEGTDSIALYVNGDLVAKVLDNVTCPVTSTQNLFFGIRHNNQQQESRPFRGSMDEIRIYNRSLNEAEIEYLSDRCSFAGDEELVNEVHSHEVLVYPNPIKNGQINIESDAGTSITDIQLYTLDGKFLKAVKNGQILDLATGTYFALVAFDDGSTTKEKIIVLN